MEPCHETRGVGCQRRQRGHTDTRHQHCPVRLRGGGVLVQGAQHAVSTAEEQVSEGAAREHALEHRGPYVWGMQRCQSRGWVVRMPGLVSSRIIDSPAHARAHTRSKTYEVLRHQHQHQVCVRAAALMHNRPGLVAQAAPWLVLMPGRMHSCATHAWPLLLPSPPRPRQGPPKLQLHDDAVWGLCGGCNPVGAVHAAGPQGWWRTPPNP